MTPSAALFGYSPSGPVLTLVLPLGLFVVVMIGMALVIHREHAVPGRQLAGGRAVPPTAAAAHPGPDGDDTAVSDTIASDVVAGAAAQDKAVSDLASGDTSSGDTPSGNTPSEDTPSGDAGAGDPAAPGSPEVPE